MRFRLLHGTEYHSSRIVYFALGCRAMAVVLVVEDEDQIRVLAEILPPRARA